MPLRDHFHPPVSKRSSWEGFHGGWPMQIVRELAPRLPEGFVAEPRVHLGHYYEIDISAFEQNGERAPVLDSARSQPPAKQFRRKRRQHPRSPSTPSSLNNTLTRF